MNTRYHKSWCGNQNPLAQDGNIIHEGGMCSCEHIDHIEPFASERSAQLSDEMIDRMTVTFKTIDPTTITYRKGTIALRQIAGIRQFMSRYREDSEKLDTLFDMLEQSKVDGGVITLSLCTLQDGQLAIPVSPAELQPKIQALIDDLSPKVAKSRMIMDELNATYGRLV